METFYFCADGQTIQGPLPAKELAARLKDGRFPKSGQVCAEGTEEWQPAGEFLEAFSSPHKAGRPTPHCGDGQEPAAVEKILAKAAGLLTSGESIKYIAIQKKPIVTISPDAIILTNRRFIVVRPKLLGMTFSDYLWTQVEDVHLSEQILGATIHYKVTGSQPAQLDSIPKNQARRVYSLSQEMEEQMHHVRRNRQLEEHRAQAGGLHFHSPPPLPGHTSLAPSSGAGDPVAALKQLKEMLDAGLVSQAEFEAKKAELLARM